MIANIEYAVVLTSCGRFDLLRRTVESFLRFADVRPRQFIVVEDSGDEKVRAALAGLDYPFEFVIRPPEIARNTIALWGRAHARQAAAIDAGYARVKTPLIFHCEDDWLFFRGGFIRESAYLLQKFPRASAVMLRGRDEHKLLRTVPYEEEGGVLFFRATPALDKTLFSYGYNPGLRRMSDYRAIGPVSPIGKEADVSRAFKRAGFYTAHLEIPAVVHLGWKRRTMKEERPKNPAAYLSYKIRKWRSNLHHRKQSRKSENSAKANNS